MCFHNVENVLGLRECLRRVQEGRVTLLVHSYNSGGTGLWAANSHGGSPPSRAVLQPDRNLVVYDCNYVAKWSTSTSIPGGYMDNTVPLDIRMDEIGNCNQGRAMVAMGLES
jgi:hypothetical protein